MTLFYEEEGALKLPFDCQTLAREVINGALEYIHCPYEVQVNLLLTMNDMKLRETSLILKAKKTASIRRQVSFCLEIL